MFFRGPVVRRWSLPYPEPPPWPTEFGAGSGQRRTLGPRKHRINPSSKAQSTPPPKRSQPVLQNCSGLALARVWRTVLKRPLTIAGGNHSYTPPPTRIARSFHFGKPLLQMFFFLFPRTEKTDGWRSRSRTGKNNLNPFVQHLCSTGRERASQASDSMEPTTGLEPVTCRLRIGCSTN